MGEGCQSIKTTTEVLIIPEEIDGRPKGGLYEERKDLIAIARWTRRKTHNNT